MKCKCGEEMERYSEFVDGWVEPTWFCGECKTKIKEKVGFLKSIYNFLINKQGRYENKKKS